MSIHVFIPARFGSTRFPGKPLALLNDEPVICHVVRAALAANIERPVFVATDDERIREAVEARFESDECRVVMTGECHTGTDRLAQAVQSALPSTNERQIVINVQGDEPFVRSEHIGALVELMRNSDLKMATLATPLEGDGSDPNVVKAVISQSGRAIYFSRASVPFDRDGVGAPRFRHLGIYAYERDWLLEMANLPPSPLEEIEKLEQLRALEHGVEIGIAVVENVVPIAIDTPEDLEKAQQFLNSQTENSNRR